MSEAAKKQGLDAITNEADEYEVKKKYIMTEARAENLRKAREKAMKLRQELKDLKKPNAAPAPTKKPSKIERELEELKAKYKEPEQKTEPIIKEDHDETTTTPRADNEPVDKPIAEGEQQDVRSMEGEQPTSSKGQTGKKPVPDRPVKPVAPKKEPIQKVKPKPEPVVEPKPEPVVEPPKPKAPLYRRCERGFLYM